MSGLRPERVRWALRFEDGTLAAGSKSFVLLAYRDRRAEGRPVEVMFRTQMVDWRVYDMSHVHWPDETPRDSA